MKLEELIEEARERVGDLAAPQKFSDTRWTRFANEAEREACRRARLLVDSTTEACCKVTLAAGTATYNLSSKVLFVRRATITGQSLPLCRLHHKDLDKAGTEWMTEQGEVVGWVVGLDKHSTLRLYRVPEAIGTAWLTVQRLPLADMVTPADDSPEVDERYHLSLVDWMAYRFFSTPDPDVRDDKKAGEALAQFEREFGPAMPAIEEAWAQEHYGLQEDDGNVYGG